MAWHACIVTQCIAPICASHTAYEPAIIASTAAAASWRVKSILEHHVNDPIRRMLVHFVPKMFTNFVTTNDRRSHPADLRFGRTNHNDSMKIQQPTTHVRLFFFLLAKSILKEHLKLFNIFSHIGWVVHNGIPTGCLFEQRSTSQQQHTQHDTHIRRSHTMGEQPNLTG